MNQSDFSAWLEELTGSYRGLRVPLPQANTTLGRSQTCDVRLPAPDVSRQHAKLDTPKVPTTCRIRAELWGSC